METLRNVSGYRTVGYYLLAQVPKMWRTVGMDSASNRHAIPGSHTHPSPRHPEEGATSSESCLSLISAHGDSQYYFKLEGQALEGKQLGKQWSDEDMGKRVAFVF